jgi:hypothetical protein
VAPDAVGSDPGATSVGESLAVPQERYRQFADFLAREVPLIQATYPDALVIVTYDEAQGGGANNGSKLGVATSSSR